MPWLVPIVAFATADRSTVTTTAIAKYTLRAGVITAVGESDVPAITSDDVILTTSGINLFEIAYRDGLLDLGDYNVESLIPVGGPVFAWSGPCQPRAWF